MKLLNQTQFAALAGVTQATVGRHLKDGEILSLARVQDRIDIEHPAAIQYIEDRVMKHVDPEYKAPRRVEKISKLEEFVASKTDADRHREKLNELASDIRALVDMSLSDLIFHFGDDYRFNEWLKSIQQVEKIEASRLKNAEKRGELVKRELIHVGIFMTLDACFRGLLTDGSKNIATKGHAMALAGRSVEELEAYVREVMGTFLDIARDKMRRCLNSV